MKRALFIASILPLFFHNHAVAQVSLDIKGQTSSFNEATRTEVQGDPYLISDWTNGSVVLESNKVINAKLKLDIHAGTVLFQDRNGQALELTNKFSSIVLNNTGTGPSDISPLVFVSGYPATGSQTDSTIYQLVADGKIKLLKYYKKELSEHREDTTSVITSRYRTVKTYFVFKKNRLTQVQPNKKSIFKVLDSHQEQVENYFKDTKFNFDSDADLKKIFDWYNGLN